MDILLPSKSFSFCEVTTYEHPYLYYVYKNTFNRKEKREFIPMLEELLINLINKTDSMSGGALIYKQLNDYVGK